jgi:hypothetical protein
MMSRQISQEEYLEAFGDGNKREAALEHALDVRKFEIDLYWKRAAYFWTFIGATFVGYVAVQASSAATKDDLSVLLSCLGIVFSVGWFCANKGSKQWQENWENHVGMLEDDTIGPLYKIVLTRPRPETWDRRLIDLVTGPSNFSVSKINQIISTFVTLLWVILLLQSLAPISLAASINWKHTAIIAATVIACASFYFIGRTYRGTHLHVATIRTTEIETPVSSNPAVSQEAKEQASV